MKSISRRSWFSALVRPIKARELLTDTDSTGSTDSPTSSSPPAMVAVVSGRHCLTYHHSPCSTCYERCPEDGAITVDQGRPTVVPDLCTGCGVCHDLCPAPVNAILMTPRPAAG